MIGFLGIEPKRFGLRRVGTGHQRDAAQTGEMLGVRGFSRTGVIGRRNPQRDFKKLASTGHLGRSASQTRRSVSIRQRHRNSARP